MKSARSNAQEAEKASGPARGPPRGGSGGPCDHCERTYSPCWRKGPPEKPLLCNACGAHYLVKKSLDGYRPGQKGARTQQLPAAKKPTAAALKRPKKKGASLLGEAAGGEESPSEAGTSGGSPVGSAGKGGRKGITPEPDSSGGKRKRTANRKYQDGNEDSDDGTASRSLQKPKPALSLSTVRNKQQEPPSEHLIASTPMAIHLLADMADRRKKQAPPPIWELTSPRGIEGARQRTFNALMKTPPSNNANKIKPPPPKEALSKVQLQHQHLQLQLQLQHQGSGGGLFADVAGGSSSSSAGGPSACDPDSLPEGECAQPLGSSLLEEHPYMKDTVLHAPGSPLPMVDMTDIVNASTWESVVTLPPSSSGAGGAVDIASLSTLVPECDRDLASVGFVKDTMFSSPAFASAMENFQGLLASGSFDKDTSASMMINSSAKVDDSDLKRLPRIGSLESMIVPLPLNGSLQSVVKKSEAVPLFAHDSPLSCSTLQTSPLVPGAFSLNGDGAAALSSGGLGQQQQQQQQQKVMMGPVGIIGSSGIDGSKTPLPSSSTGLLVPAPVTPLAIPQASTAGR